MHEEGRRQTRRRPRAGGRREVRESVAMRWKSWAVVAAVLAGAAAGGRGGGGGPGGGAPWGGGRGGGGPGGGVGGGPGGGGRRPAGRPPAARAPGGGGPGPATRCSRPAPARRTWKRPGRNCTGWRR